MEIINIENGKYLNVSLFSLNTLANEAIELLGYDESKEIRNEIGAIWSSLIDYERSHEGVDLKEVLIRKDSKLASFILNSQRQNQIKGIDAYISYENVISAYLTAVTTENKVMVEALEILLKNRISGFIDKIPFEISPETMQYIFLNGNLESFIKNESYETKEYAVFENDKIRHMVLQYRQGRN